MPSFDSPLGNKRFGGTGLREFEVPDESEPVEQRPSSARHAAPNLDAIREFQARLDAESDDDHVQQISQTERDIREARMARKTGKERLNDGARRRIEMLVGMSRLNRPVQIDDNSFILQTLKSKEMREVFIATAEFDGTVQSPYEMRRQLVARSLVQIANYDVAQFLGSDSLAARLEFVDELPESLLGRLFNEYQLLVQESTEKFAIKTDADAQEVMADLKK